MATSKYLKPRRGSTAEHSTFKGEAYEITFDTDKKTIVAHDGLTMGGFPLAHEAAVATVDSELRALIDQKVSNLEGVAPSELAALDTALRGLINLNAQQQTTRDRAQDDALTSLDKVLRALIAEEVAKAMAASSAAQTSADAANAGLVGVVRSVNGNSADEGGNVTLSKADITDSLGYTPLQTAPVTSVNGSTGAVTVSSVTTATKATTTPNVATCIAGKSSGGSYASNKWTLPSGGTWRYLLIVTSTAKSSNISTTVGTASGGTALLMYQTTGSGDNEKTYERAGIALRIS